MADSILEYFSQPQNMLYINKLISAGVNTVDKETGEIQDQRFSDMVFVLTGTLESFTRSEASEIIESMPIPLFSNVDLET